MSLLTLLNAPAGGGGPSLSVIVSTTGAAVNLTSLSADDWAQWGSNGPTGTPSNRKSGGGSTISVVTTVGAAGTPGDFGNDPRTISWTDGTPNASSSATTGIYNTGSAAAGDGLTFTLPADTSPRQAWVYFGGFFAEVKFTATLSDGSAGPAVDTSFSTVGIGAGDALAVIDYSAGSAGQTLTIRVECNTAAGNTPIQAAAVKVTSTGTSLTPGVGSVAFTGYAPTIAQPQSYTPGAGSLAFAGYAPTIAQPQALVPGAASIAFVGYAATLAQTANQALTPGAGSVGFTGYAPTVSQSAASGLTPAAGALTFTGYAPGVSQPQALVPGVGALAFTGYVPSVLQPQAMSPGVASITFTGHAPGLAQTANQSLVPGAAGVVFAGFVPTVAQAGGSTALMPDVRQLVLTGYAPTVVRTGSDGVQLLGGGPGGPRKRTKGGTESYLERLLGRPLDEEPEPEEIEIIEQAAELAAVAAKPPTRDEAADALRMYGVALRDAYVEIFQELERRKRQQLEDDEIAAIIAAAF